MLYLPPYFFLLKILFNFLELSKKKYNNKKKIMCQSYNIIWISVKHKKANLNILKV